MKTTLIALPSRGRVRRFFTKSTRKSAKLAGTVLHTTVMLNACAPATARPNQPRPTANKITPEVGYAGVEVEILGSNLGFQGENTRVYFGDQVTVPISTSGTEIRVRVPAGATPGPVCIRVGAVRVETPPFTLALPDDTPWKHVSAGSFHTCAVQETGALYCWGDNGARQLGYETPAQSGPLPARVGKGLAWESVIGGMYIQNGNSCGLQQGGMLHCWGDNSYGQYGDNTLSGDGVPTPTNNKDWREVSLGAYHACGVTNDNLGYCWGRNNFGQLGIGAGFDIEKQPAPLPVSGPASWTSIRVGSLHSCGITIDHDLYCWGKNLSGQLGDGTLANSTVPVSAGAGFKWKMVGPGSYITNGNTCAVTTAGKLYCWGDNTLGQLGNGSLEDSTTPTAALSRAAWDTVTVGGSHVCGIQSDHTLWCWGKNNEGQLGLGRAGEDTRAPQQVGQDRDWSAVSAGASHTCALKQSGKLFCWGANAAQQVGVMTGRPFEETPMALEHSLR